MALVERLVVAIGRLLEAAERQTLLARRLLDLREQVVNRLVAGRGDADAPAASHEVGDEARTRPGLAGPRRPLDEEVARVEGRRELTLLADIDRLHDPARRPAQQTRRRSREDVAQRPIAPVVGKDRRREASQRAALLPV